jgi:hypothetical protein
MPACQSVFTVEDDQLLNDALTRAEQGKGPPIWDELNSAFKSQSAEIRINAQSLINEACEELAVRELYRGIGDKRWREERQSHEPSTREEIEACIRNEYDEMTSKVRAATSIEYVDIPPPIGQNGTPVLGRCTPVEKTMPDGSLVRLCKIEIYQHGPGFYILETLTHELRHAEFILDYTKHDEIIIEQMFRERKEKYKRDFEEQPTARLEDIFVNQYASKKAEEFLCETMAIFKHDPESLRELDPEAFKYFQDRYLETEVQRMLEKLQL